MFDTEKTITITRKEFADALAASAAYVATEIDEEDKAFAFAFLSLAAVMAKLADDQLFEGKKVEDLLDDDDDDETDEEDAEEDTCAEDSGLIEKLKTIREQTVRCQELAYKIRNRLGIEAPHFDAPKTPKNADDDWLLTSIHERLDVLELNLTLIDAELLIGENDE